MIDVPYASAQDIVAQLLDLLMPRSRETVSQFACKHRYLSNPGGGRSGMWAESADLVPYVVEPQDCLNTVQYLSVAVVGPGQSGKTEIAQNWLLKSVLDDPANMLWYMQNDDALEAFVKNRINGMIDLHEGMRSRQGRRPSDDSIHFKGFRGMNAEFLGAAHSNLINKSAPRIVADEIDAWLKSLGDVKAMLDVRRQTFGRQSTLLALSHPDRARGLNPERDWTDGIMAIYADSDRRVWYWQCPHCGAWSSPVPIAARVMVIDYPPDGSLDEIEAEARLVCPSSGCLIEDGYRREMNRYGRWIGDGQEISEDGIVTGELVRRDTAGFWIVGAMSPFILGGIGGLARARAKAERERDVSDEDKTIRQVMVKQWGFPYVAVRGAGSVDANDLADRAERSLKLGVVPEGVRFLTAVTDIQLAHFEYLVRGWGINGESWIIDRGKILADPATSADDWDKLLHQVFLASYPLADGSGRRMRIRGSGYDSGGVPGVTLQAYSAWTRWARQRHLRLYGKIGARDAWSILPTNGAQRLTAPRLAVVYPDTARQANVRAAAGNVPLARFNTNLFKDDLAGQLKRAEPGDWYVHFPYELRTKQEPLKQPHVWFEQLTAEQQLKDGRWQKTSSSMRNEALDLMVLAHVIARLHGIGRIDWSRPPPWAASWDRNSMIDAPASGNNTLIAAAAVPLTPAPPVSHGKSGAAPAAGPATAPQEKRSLVSRLR